ncbi:MAG: SH3 domain-containing protein [Pelagimonas sp.]
MVRAIIIWIFVSATAVFAEELPRLHDVSGVAADDVLNVRAGPGGSHPIVGTLQPNQQGVEVIRIEGNWGLVNVEERAGWASLSYLVSRDDGNLGNAQRLVCHGTEPFWDLDIYQGQQAVMKTPSNFDGETYHVGLFQGAWSQTRKWTLLGSGARHELSMVLLKTQCSDGMSDREFGFDATVFLAGPDARTFTGCCQLQD